MRVTFEPTSNERSGGFIREFGMQLKPIVTYLCPEFTAAQPPSMAERTTKASMPHIAGLVLREAFSAQRTMGMPRRMRQSPAIDDSSKNLCELRVQL